MSYDNYPAPPDDEHDAPICKHCHELAPEGVAIDENFDCNECEAESTAISGDEYEADQYAAHCEDRADRMRDDGF